MFHGRGLGLVAHSINEKRERRRDIVASCMALVKSEADLEDEVYQ